MKRRDKQAEEYKLRTEIWFANMTAHRRRINKQKWDAYLHRVNEAREQARKQAG